jgi:hypothetical protein
MEEKVSMDDKIEFMPKLCPTCKELLAVKHLGGTYDPYPKVKKSRKSKK